MPLRHADAYLIITLLLLLLLYTIIVFVAIM